MASTLSLILQVPKGGCCELLSMDVNATSAWAASNLSRWRSPGEGARLSQDCARWRRSANRSTKGANASTDLAQAADAVHAEHSVAWRNKKHVDQWISTLRTYAIPIIGGYRVDQIDSPDILRVLSPIWMTKPETARRVRQRIGTVVDWAKAAGHRDGENPINGVLKGLPKQPDNKKHHAAMPYKQVPAFVQRLHGQPESGLGSRIPRPDLYSYQ